MIDLCIIYERKSIVYQIVAYDPYEHEIKESVHEMLFEYVFSFDYLLVNL